MQQRKFVFLEAIDSAYAIHSRSLKGHVQLNESKGKTIAKVFIEGIKPEEYGIDVMIEGQKVKNIGNFTGKDKVNFTFTVEECLEKIQAIAIYPLKDRRAIVLVAYLVNRDSINIKEILYFKGSHKVSEKEPDFKTVKDEEFIKVEEPVNLKESTKVEELIKSEGSIKVEKKSIEERKETFEENTTGSFEKKEIEEAIAPEAHSSHTIEESPVIDKEPLKTEYQNEKTIETKLNKEEEVQRPNKGENKGGIYNNTIFYLWENLDKLDDILEPASPFNQPIQNHKWWYVKEFDTDIQYYCILYNGYLMPMIYPFMNYKNIHAIARDWIFGVVTENSGDKNLLKYFVYGIPGSFYMQEQPFRGSTGYLYWQSEDIVKSEPMGYWLLYVDVHTGKIVIPRRPVKPPLNKQIMHNNM